MAAKPTMLTAEGLKNLEEELAELQNVKRKEIAEKIKVARSYGDLSENSEYDDAKNEQAIMEARIATIESILKTAQIIDESETSNDKVHLTSVVTIEMVGTDRQMTYKIVGSGSNETNPAQGKISDDHLWARLSWTDVSVMLLRLKLPAAVKAFKILEISKYLFIY